MEHQDIDHKKAQQNVQKSEEAMSLMTEAEKKALQELVDQLGD